jgi:hypothetical protein
MEATNELAPGRRPYVRPTCERLSVQEVRRRALNAWLIPGHGTKLRRDRRTYPVLLVSGYRGEASLIEAPLLATGIYCRSVAHGEGMWVLSTSPPNSGAVAEIPTAGILIDRRETNIVRDSTLKQVTDTRPYRLGVLEPFSARLKFACSVDEDRLTPEEIEKWFRYLLSGFRYRLKPNEQAGPGSRLYPSNLDSRKTGQAVIKTIAARS